ncbi:hypothetical protein OAY95_03185 [Candidatus Pelagibacter sp.]|nr:hypothetical protein [Candidatus Pelagibacter sp.]
MKISKSLNNFIFFLSLFLFFEISFSYSNDPVDIWDIKKIDSELAKDEIQKNNVNIISSNIESENKKQTISSFDIIGKQEIQLIGLYDPQENNLNIDMWMNTDGDQIKSIIKKINTLNLSVDASEIFKVALLTNSYLPNININGQEFISFKQDFLIKNKDLELIKIFLEKNRGIVGNQNLIKFYLDTYLVKGEEIDSCNLFNDLNIIETDEYIDKFKIYCLIKSEKKEEAQLYLDLKKEDSFKDKYFEKIFSILMGYADKEDIKISDKSVLDFHLSRLVSANFSYVPSKNTSKSIWKYLSSNNLLERVNDIDLENTEKIKTIEKATHDGNYAEEDLFNLYKRFNFTLDELLNVNEKYKLMSNHKGRALLYQRILLTYDIDEKLKLSKKLKKYMKDDEINNAFYLELSKILKEIKIEDIPSDHTTFYEKNVINEMDLNNNIKFNNKILHQSKLLNYFIKDVNNEKISKDTNEILKKIKSNKKYIFSRKDKILLDSLRYDGINIQKKFDNLYEKDPNIPTDLQVLINNNNIGMILLRLVEIIGEDQIDSLGTETLYFIIAVLNETNLDNLRNKIIIKTLPNRV